MMKNRGQAAMEFLMTYGWAILVIIIVIAVLFYMGVLDPRNTQPNICMLPAGFSCYSFKLVNGSGALIFDLGQSVGKQIMVTGITCSMNASAQPIASAEWSNITLSSGEHDFVSGGDSDNLVNCTDENGDPIAYAEVGDTYHGRLCVRYTELDTAVNRVVCGDISARFEPGSSGDFPSQHPAKPGWFIGNVTEGIGLPVEDATVIASDGVSFWGNTTNGTGGYVIYGLHPGDYSLNASKAGYQNTSVTGAPIYANTGSGVNLFLASDGLPSCSPNCPTGSPCTNNSNCTSGYCDPVNFTCQTAPNCYDYATGVINRCPCTLYATGTYSLESNLPSSGTCITIQSGGSNSVLDCQGHTITGTKTGYGIYSVANGITINNCVISNFTYGIFLHLSSNVHLISNTLNSNTEVGIELQKSDNIVITSNNANSNDGGTVTGIGIRGWLGSNLTFTGNTLNSNTGYGISLQDVANTNLISNTINSNQFGLQLRDSSNTNLTGNTVTLNLNHGVMLTDVTGIILTGNTICSNNQSGGTGFPGIYSDLRCTGNNVISGSSTYSTNYMNACNVTKSGSC